MFHYWLHARDGTGSAVRTALLDFRKAFDPVDHHILVAKLLSLGVKPRVVNWALYFLRSRQQRVKLNGVVSDWVDVPAGVPQGTRLDPWLFLAMITISVSQKGSTCANSPMTTISEVVPASKHSSPQQAADYIHNWSQENHLQLNSTKCKGDPHVLQAHSPCFCQVSIEGVEFEMVSSAKVLGVIIINGLYISTQSRLRLPRDFISQDNVSARVLLTMILLDFIVALLDQS